jgi:hypothetical protein
MHRTLTAFALFTLFVAPAKAQPIRCGTQLIEPGDSMERVLEFCGQPDQSRQWTVTIPAGDDDEGMMDAVQIPMAEWDYDDDPDAFVDKVIFKNGIVQEIRN